MSFQNLAFSGLRTHASGSGIMDRPRWKRVPVASTVIQVVTSEANDGDPKSFGMIAYTAAKGFRFHRRRDERHSAAAKLADGSYYLLSTMI